jgi:hypothetical protein
MACRATALTPIASSDVRIVTGLSSAKPFSAMPDFAKLGHPTV